MDYFANWFQTLTGLSPSEGLAIEGVRPSANPLPHQRLCLLNWNVAKQNQQPVWRVEFDRICQCYQPDLYFFQEARLPWPIEANSFPAALAGYLESDLGWYFSPNLTHDRHAQASGVLTASRSRSLNSRALYSHHREPLLRTPKVALVTEHPIGRRSQTLLAIDVHAINFVRSHMFEAQLHQIEAAIAHHTGPLILAGDFNTWSPKRTTLLQALVRRLQLQQVIFPADANRHLKRFLFSGPLDSIFYRGLDLLPESTAVLGDCNSSDHNPMVVSFSLPHEVD